jgi:hypothetical protein
VVEASKGLVPILADCSDRSKNGDLKQKYGVRGFPTVVFLDSKGNEVEKLRGRDAASVKAQIEGVVEKHTVKLFPDMSLEDGRAKAAEEGKLLAVVFQADGGKHEAKNAQLKAYLLHDEMAQTFERFVWVIRPLKGEDGKSTDEAKLYKAKKSPTVLVIDPAADEGKSLKKLTSFKKLKKDLDKLADKHAK